MIDMSLKRGDSCNRLYNLRDLTEFANYLFDNFALDRKILYSVKAVEEIPNGPNVAHVSYSLAANTLFGLYSNAVEYIDNLFQQNSHASFLVWRKTPEIKIENGTYTFYMRLSFATHEKQTNI